MANQSRRPSNGYPNDRRHSSRRPASQGPQPQGRREAPRRPQQQGRRPAHAPAHGAHARPATPPRRRSTALPIVISALIVLLVGVGGFFAVRACTNRANTPNDQSAQTDTAAQDAQATASQAKDDSVDINLMMVGDMLFHYQVRMSGLQDDGTRNYDHLFTHVLDELEGQDIKVINQETPIAGQVYTGSAPDGYDGYPEFNGPQEVGDAEVKAGFNVILKATNHAMDNSGNFDDPYTLVRAEQNFWKENHPEVAVIGEANPDDPSTSANDVYIYEKDGFKVALLNYTKDLNGNESRDSQGMVSMLTEDHVKTTMAAAREQADMIVVFPHWGEEYSTQPVDEQYTWARLFVEEGADVIIGNHPHVIEPVTLLNGSDGKQVPCFWSTGNFVSTSPSDESLIGGMAKVTLHKDAEGACSVAAATFTPLVSHLGLSTDMTTYLLRDWTDDLAASNWLNTDVNPDTDNTSLTPAWADQFCSEVLGAGYDSTRKVFELDFSPASLPVTTDGERA